MKIFSFFFQLVHAFMALLFAAAAFVLLGIVVNLGREVFLEGLNETTAQKIIAAIGLLAISVVSLKISKTIIEEEVVRDANLSAPTRVRRYLSRFFVVVIVALTIESLVATFKAIHEDMTQLTYASFLIIAVGVLLSAWGMFIYLNRFAEELEPVAMAEAKQEDKKLKD